jgi:hypothetical protein
VDQEAGFVMFEFSVWKIAVWALATFGVAGTIALIVFAPALAKVAASAVVRCFAFVFSYRLGCAVVAALLAYAVADYVRRSIEDDRHAAANAAFVQKQIERDARIKTETRELVLKEVAAAAAENAATDKDVKDFTDALPIPPPTPTGNPFLIGADVCRLRAIYGQTECRPDGATGVPKTDAPAASLRDRIRKRLSGSGG